MKKIIYSAMAVAMLATTSCKDDFAESFVGEEATVEFSISTPEIGTRYGEGTTVNKLHYAVYDNGTLLTELTKNDVTFNGSANLQLQLKTGKTYDLVFWADNASAPYEVDFSKKTMTIDYENSTVSCNDEELDAFYKHEKITVEGNRTLNVKLTRPFAQLNIAASDFEEAEKANYIPNASSIKVYGAANTLNFLTGAITGKVDVTFASTAIPTEDLTVNDITYDYLAMTYVLPADNKTVMDIDFTIVGNTHSETRTVGSVPFQSNYRTNIYGNILTSQQEVNITIDPAFGGDKTVDALFQAAAFGGEVTLTEDVVLDAPLNVQANMTLNLNGKTITTTLEQEGRHHYAIFNNANLVLEGEGAIEARGIKNFGEMTVNGNVAIKNIDSNGGAAIWNEGKVTINNGTFISSEGAGANTYGAALNTRSGGEAVVNGGTFEAYSQLTYAIVNEGKTTINNATVKGKHGAVAGAESNDQTTINGGSFELMGVSGQSDHCAYFVSVIRGGVFSRNEADTTAGDSVFWESKIAAGYKAIEKDGKYYVVPAEAVVVTTAKELQEALANRSNVVLTNDIDFGSTQLAIAGENQVVDLGGHTLTTANNWGGISLKNGACIKNGTITHAGNTAAIKAFNGTSVENVTIKATCSTADKTVTGIAVQQGANVESIKNVTINGVSQGIEVGYQATVGLIENAVVNESNNGTAKGIGLVINGGKVGKAKDCTFKGETYGITLHLKGVFAAGLELENCTVEGTTASIYAWDEKGISNTSGSLILTYDAATTLNGPFVWDFEDECQSVVTLNRPQ